jgi:non-heme chloroperoxidase
LALVAELDGHVADVAQSNEYLTIKDEAVLARLDPVERAIMETLLLQGNDDQIVPIDIASRRSVKILPNASLKEYAGAPHGVCVTHADRVNANLLAFLKG